MDSVSRIKSQAVSFVRQMFKDRHYKHVDFNESMDYVITETRDGRRVLAVFASFKKVGEILEIQDVSQESCGEEDDYVDDPEGDFMKDTKTGINVIKQLCDFCEKNNIKIVIWITDSMTSQATRYGRILKEIEFVHFRYEETGVENIARHIYQPLVFEALNHDDRLEFIREHPNYRDELPRYAFDDALVKYYGMRIDDIIYIEDNDQQTGLVIEYGLVVEDL